MAKEKPKDEEKKPVPIKKGEALPLDPTRFTR